MRFRLLSFLIALCLSSSHFATQGNVNMVLLLIASAFVPYGVLLWMEHRGEAPVSSHERMAWVLVTGCGLLLSPSILSDDIFRFVWDGSIVAKGMNPYAHAPSDPALAAFATDVSAKINNPSLITIYPPIAQAWFWVLTRFSESIWSLKVGALLAHGLTAFALSRWYGSKAALAFGMNPLCLSESAASGHLDVLVGLALLSAGWAWEHGRERTVAVALFLASGLKLVGIACVPLLRNKRTLLLAAAMSGLPLVVMVSATGSSSASGVTNYARRWSGNASGYNLFRAASASTLVAVFPGDDPDTLALPKSVHRLVQRHVRHPPIVESRRLVKTRGMSELVARALVVLCLMLAIVTIRRMRLAPLSQLRSLLWCVLLLSPQVHPWYLLWLLPIEAASKRWSGFLWSFLVMLAYLPLSRWLSEGIWIESNISISVQYVLVISFLLWEGRNSLPRRNQ